LVNNCKIGHFNPLPFTITALTLLSLDINGLEMAITIAFTISQREKTTILLV
jgi:hypothetical protein